MRYPFMGLLLLLFSCSQNESTGLDINDIHGLLNPMYEAPLELETELSITRRDKSGTQTYPGHLKIDRADTSELVIPEAQPFILQYSENHAKITKGDDRVLDLDLTNKAHNILLFREITVVEPNPFRYLERFYSFYIDPDTPDSTRIIAKLQGAEESKWEIHIVIQKGSGMVRELYFYSPRGDMARHVVYGRVKRLNGYPFPTQITIDFVDRSNVVQEIYHLETSAHSSQAVREKVQAVYVGF
ncbi:hypothetical protein GF406_07290 [candidate division KSB1 bacterium]|nr:hypothetical protein [candidate division KSB1 bacterium]